jgi:hypothetical protein
VSVGRIEGIVEDCAVYLNGNDTNTPGGEFAYNATNTRSAIFRRNFAQGAQRGFNNDSAPNETITIAENTFIMPPGANFQAKCYGIYLITQTTWSRIYDNNITISGNDSSGIIVQGATPLRGESHDLFVHNNRIYKASHWTGNVVGYGFNFQPGAPEPFNIHLEFNTVSPELNNLVPGQVGAVMLNDGVYSYWSNSVLHSLQQPKWWGYRYTPNRLDLNMDRSLDLIFSNSSGELRTWLMSGRQYWQQGTISPSSSNPWLVVGSGDFNRDGRSDLVLTLPLSTEVGCWGLDGHTLKQPWLVRDAATGETCPTGSYRIACVGDMNNDGSADLIVQHPTGLIGAWYMRGGERISYALFNPINAGHYRAVGTGDFNRDGNTDSLFQHNDYYAHHEGSLGVWHMDGSGNAVSIQYLTPLKPEDKNWRAVATGDFDGDGHVDIVFQYKQHIDDWGGDLRIWKMDGLQRMDVFNLGNPGTAYSVVGPK